jgi:hypothetical protein
VGEDATGGRVGVLTTVIEMAADEVHPVVLLPVTEYDPLAVGVNGEPSIIPEVQV